jgi:hypothetical protein
VFTRGDVSTGDLTDAVQRDPEVHQARMIADAARTRLLACVSGPRETIDLAEAQRMLHALGNAQAFARDAEDRVLAHRGLLTQTDATRVALPVPPRGRHPGPLVFAGALVTLAVGIAFGLAAGLAGAALGRRGIRVRRPRVRR